MSTIRELAEAACGDLYPTLEVREKDTEAVKDEVTAFVNWAMKAHGTDKIEAAIRAAGAPLAEALRLCHAALENEGYQDDPAEAEHPFLSPAMVAARAALAAWEAK